MFTESQSRVSTLLLIKLYAALGFDLLIQTCLMTHALTCAHTCAHKTVAHNEGDEILPHAF